MTPTQTSIVASPRHPHIIWIAALGSMLLHALLPVAILLDPMAWLDRLRTPPETSFEVVFLPPEPEPPPPPEPEPPAPAAPTPPPTPMVTRPPPPQLEEAPIAERSRPEPAPEPQSEDARPPPQATPTERRQRQPRQPLPSARDGTRLPPVEMPRRAEVPSLLDHDQPTMGRTSRRGGSAASQQQSEGDFVLAQIMPHWLIDVRSPRFREIVLGGTFHLQADGTLASPYGKHDPWSPDRMIQNYRQLNTPQGEPIRIALESFLRAARNAQPFKLPPGAQGGFPRPIRIVFAMGDL